MDEKPLVEGYIANFCISLDFLSFCILEEFFLFKKKKLGFLGPPYCGISDTIRIGREMLCLPYAGFFLYLQHRALDGIGYRPSSL